MSVPNEQYFLLGDNRTGAIDSRTFGPVLGNAIFAKVFAVFWPLRDITLPARPVRGRAARTDRLQLTAAAPFATGRLALVTLCHMVGERP